MQLAKKVVAEASQEKAELSENVLFMSSGDVQRAFRITSGAQGIDVYDVDNDVFACKGMFSGSSTQRKFAEMMLPNLGWKEFSSFISNQKEYAGNVADISGAFSVPSPGNAERQVAAGMRPVTFSDIRTPDMIADDRDHTLEYRYPAVSRDGAIAEIMAHHVVVLSGTGKSAIGWDVRMSHRWDRSGAPVDKNGEEIDSSHDAAWAKVSLPGSDVFTRCCDRALAPHLEDEDLALHGANGGFVYVAEIAGTDMTFSSLSDLRSGLESLDNGDLAALWCKVRTLDVDLSLQKRTEAVMENMNAERAEFEAGLDDPEDVSDLAI